ncbi:MAG: hypothetical protein F4190_15490 [Acidimicrobiales bacterium]|uniref:hypothetical protein n=1 Tax=Candidatus Poriferisodalis multihospitum TaxID=2983191 RepID=UPI001382D52F|nr:hypothetical protein [Candidatus Poriferisodalis multihospitum]MCY3607558.1 hypothetical protein [Acidimicrobiaceae bacterium]MDE0196448.1 hypothetical protein [bacterium]MXY01957.1 hypothetical protein [Acidimicrobiales bacterium]MXZ16592.1 hypothetical protein [Acidimicrobiales bacterium]MYA81309.1 hypothetical protein [Acidimicrobiales bacterium]
MDSPVTKLIFIAAAVAASVLVVTVMWTTLGANAPQTSGIADKSKITTEALCDAVDGTWTAANTPPCA